MGSMTKRKFLIDGGFLFGAETLARLFAFSVTFFLARQVGLEALAVLSLAQALIAYALVAGDAGLGTAAVRRIALGQESHEVIRDTARAQVLLASIASLVVVPIVAVQTSWLIALSLSTLPLIAAASTTYVLQGRLDARGIAYSRVTGNLVVGVLGIGLSLLACPLWVIAFSYPVGAVAAMLVVNTRSGASLGLVFGRVNLVHLRSEARPYMSLALFTVVLHAYSSCLIILSQNLDQGQHFIDVALSTRLLLIMVIPAQVLGSLLLPRYSKVSHNDLGHDLKRHLAMAFTAGCAITFAVWLTADSVVPILFGSEAEGSVLSVQVISVQVPLSLVSTVLVAALLAHKAYGTVGRIYLFTLGVQILAGFWLVGYSSPIFICALLIAEACFVILLSFSFGRMRKLHPNY